MSSNRVVRRVSNASAKLIDLEEQDDLNKYRKRNHNAAGSLDKQFTRDREDSNGIEDYRLYEDDVVESNSKCSFSRVSCCLKRLCVSFLVLIILVSVSSYSIRILSSRDPCVVSRMVIEDVTKMNGETRIKTEGWHATIPKIIHQQWKTNNITNAYFRLWQSRWKVLYPETEYKHILWTDATMDQFMREKFSDFYSMFKSYKYEIERADSSRYFILYHYGGVYADLDFEPLENFWDHIPKDRVTLIESPYRYNEHVQNSFMASPKNDPFWWDVFAGLRSEHSKSILSATGPILLDTVSKTTNEPFYVLPCENFQRIPIGESRHSPFLSQLHREFFGRFYPMKYCGSFSDMKCQLARHHNTATYLSETGLIDLIF